MAKTCSKCSGVVVRVPGSNSFSIGLGLMKGIADITRFVCTECGLVELYVEDRAKLKHIAERFQ